MWVGYYFRGWKTTTLAPTDEKPSFENLGATVTPTDNNSKYYANTLRIIEIINKILNNPKWEYNNLLIPDNIEYLYWIKTTSDFNKVFRKDYFNNICLETELKLQEYYNNHELVFIPTICEEINKIQNKIMKQYIKLNF